MAKNVTKASETKSVEVVNTLVKYKTDKEIYSALDNLTGTEKSFRSELQAVLVSAIAHHEACAAKGGSIGTVVTKVWAGLEEMKAIPKQQISRYFSAIFPKLKWNKREMRFDGKQLFRPVIKPAKGRAQHYSGIAFWDFAPKANVSVFNVEERIAVFMNALQRALNSEEHPLEGDAKARAQLTIDFLDLVKTGKPDTMKELAHVTSIAQAGNHIELVASRATVN